MSNRESNSAQDGRRTSQKDTQCDDAPPSTLSPQAVANQVEKITENHKEELSGYEKSWLQSAVDYLRYLDGENDAK